MADATPSRTFTVIPADPGAIELPFDVKAVFGRARPPVHVTVGAHSYRSTVAVMSGRVFVPFRRSHREAAGVIEGEPFSVTLTLDTAPRTVDVPDDLRAALEATDAWARWDALSFTHQREHVEAVEQAKKPETRARRIANCVAMLTR